MKKLTIALLASASLALSGCASYSQMDRVLTKTQFQDAKVEQSTINKPEFVLPKPAGGPIVVAVYSFLDRTGQRKASPMVAHLSSCLLYTSDAADE